MDQAESCDLEWTWVTGVAIKVLTLALAFPVLKRAADCKYAQKRCHDNVNFEQLIQDGRSSIQSKTFWALEERWLPSSGRKKFFEIGLSAVVTNR